LVAVNDSETDLGSPTTLTATVATGSDITYYWPSVMAPPGRGCGYTRVPAAGTYTAVVTASNLLHSFTATTTVTIVAPTTASICRW
jgi:hypothetical protein